MRSWNDDPFTKKARKENYEARSIYKLSEIDHRERIFKGVKTVLDLGAAPGSWTQYCLEKLPPTGRIIAVDLNPINVVHPRVTFLQGSIEDLDLNSVVPSGKVEMVLSDMAPKTSGIHNTDVALSIELATLALDCCRKFLKPGGTFIVKVFMGPFFEDYQREIKSAFGSTRIFRPVSVRKQSREIYFLAKDFRAPN